MGGLTALIKTLRPAALSKSQREEWGALSKAIYIPQARRSTALAEQYRRVAEGAPDEATRDALLRAAEREEYKAARFGMMDKAADTIAFALPRIDEGLETKFLSGGERGAPVGIANFYRPGKYVKDDPELNTAGYLEQLAATGEVPGTGKSLLYSMGQAMPEDPVMWLSLPYPETMDFYASRGAQLYSPKPGSQISDRNYPVFRVERGDLIKKKRGGLVQYCECEHD